MKLKVILLLTASILMTIWLLNLSFPAGQAQAQNPTLDTVLRTTTPSPTWDALTPMPTTKPLTPILTSTPRPDGAVVHKVLEGQFLDPIARAYGVTINFIYEMNRWPSGRPLYAGDNIIIRPSSTITPTPRETATPIPSSTHPPTLTKTITPTLIPSLTPTPLPTATPTSAPFFGFLEGGNSKQWIGIGIIGICVIGLVFLLINLFKKK